MLLRSFLCGELRERRANHAERLLQSQADAQEPDHKRDRVGVCGTCMDARGIKPESIVEVAKRSSMDELADWTQEADKVLVF
jgi:sulfur relay (sulfurtransferase) complex TusBCD TusD component (DsrE family)